MRGELVKFKKAKEEKELELDSLETEVDQLGIQFGTNGTLIRTLIEDIATSGKKVRSGKYAEGKSLCETQRQTIKQDTIDCETDDKDPILTQRNTSCQKVRGVVKVLLEANGEGWSQCSCPNGILKDTHGICPKDKYSCNACYDDFFKETSENCTIKEFKLKKDNTSTYEDAKKVCSDKGKRLCSYEEVCPKGAEEEPHGGQIKGDVWVPIVNNSFPAGMEDWASIGEYNQHSGNFLCKSYGSEFGATPVIGTFTRSKVFCCPDESEKGCHYEQCAELSNCAKGFYEKEAATETSNRVCEYKRCSCTNGSAGEGETCPKHETEHCTECNNGYTKKVKATYKDMRNKQGINYQFTQEEAQKECAKFGETLCPKSVIDNENLCDHGWMRDHEFPGYNNGIGAFGCGAKGWNERNEDGLGNAHCCTIESESACMEKQCKCPNGTPKTGVDCPTDGSTNCASCKAGYYVTGSGSCALKKCTCSHGTAAWGPACPANGGAKCAKCDGGYNLESGACFKKVNCVAKWPDTWGECSACYEGTQSRTQVIDIAAQHGGAACNLQTESQDCNTTSVCPSCWSEKHEDNECSRGDSRDDCIKHDCAQVGLSYDDRKWQDMGDWYFRGCCGADTCKSSTPNCKDL